MRKILASLALASSALALAPAAHAEHGETAVGAAIGAVSGAIIGHHSGGRDGAIVGGALGGAIGAAIGNDFGDDHRSRVRYIDYPDRHFDRDRHYNRDRYYDRPQSTVIIRERWYPPRPVYVEKRIIRDYDRCDDGWGRGGHGWGRPHYDPGRAHGHWKHDRHHRRWN